MCVVSLILLAVFVSFLVSFRINSQRVSENILRQALYARSDSPGLRPPLKSGERNPANRISLGDRMPILVAEVDAGDKIVLLINQLHFIDETEAKSAIQEAMDTNGTKGIMYDYELRWLKSEDGSRIALVDISMEQEMLKSLIINSLLIGVASLTSFYLISLLLARWAVRPIELAWERQRQFVADASHELKTPLTVILSNAEMLGNKEVFADEKNIRRIEHIRAESNLMKNLVEDLLTLAKADSVERVKIGEKVDFSYVVTNAVLTFEPIAFDEQKSLSYDIRDNIFVTGDAGRLQQLIVILLDNAVKYCPLGGKIKIDLNEVDKKTALLTVTNDGEPIPKEELSQVFERFYRVDKSRSTHGSFGLGLSIAQSIVADHNGKIWVESGEDTENSFHVSLPLIIRTENRNL